MPVQNIVTAFQSHLFDIVFGFFMLVLGFILGPAVERVSLGTRPPANAPSSTVTVNVAISQRRTVVRQTRVTKKSGYSYLDDLNPVEFIVSLVIAVVVFAAGYLRFRDIIVLVLLSIACFGVGLSASAIIYLARRRLVIGRAWTTLLIWSFTILSIGFVNAVVLYSPPFYEGDFREVESTFAREGISGLMDGLDLTVIWFLVYQLVGVLAFAGAAVVLAGNTLFLLSAANLAVARRGRTFWGVVSSWTAGASSPGWALATATLLAVLSFALCSGLVQSLLPDAPQRLGVPLEQGGQP